MLQILWICLDQPASAAEATPALHTFPGWLQQKIAAHRTTESARASYWGYRLLQLATSHWPSPVWDHLAVDAWGRPHLPATGYDFNLSHSGTCVVCALHSAGRVGVDTQWQHHPIRLQPAHKALFRPDEWTQLVTNPTTFTDVWAQKEAVAKADGRGLAAFPHIQLFSGSARITDTGTTWIITEVRLHPANRTYLATPTIPTLHILQVNQPSCQ